MKLFFISLVLLLNLLHADEIQRIESIINDINKLEVDYTRVQDDLVEMRMKLQEEKQITKSLRQDLELYSNSTKKEETHVKKILSLKSEIKKLKKSLIIKEKTVKIKPIVKNNLNNQNCDDDNEFPLLLMKEKLKCATIAKTYRVKREASIYDGQNANEITIWEEATSFTSNYKTLEWIKITGYFVDKVWRASEKEMWIKTKDSTLRDNR